MLHAAPKQKLSSEERKKILLDIADALEANEDAIRSENEADVEAAQAAGYEKSLVARMTLKPGKVVLCFSQPIFFLFIVLLILLMFD